jgi:Major capsid protein N-terminus/Large eukaryotic DNA virus major capsid protein
MAGGLLNLISTGNNNLFLTGNPTKTFFKVTYAKHTNFGLQKFRIDYDGLRDLRLTEPSTFTFKMPRYAELLMDTYLVINLPTIWSPIYNPCTQTVNQWAPYDFRWIRELGTNMISEISITCGSQTIQKYSGDYLRAMVERDFSAEKKQLFDEMTGNVTELNDPANAYSRQNAYPSAYYSGNGITAEPSIRARKLYIPINTWFTLDSRCAFPMISLQYNELQISITMRPIQELFQVRDVWDTANQFPYIQPDFNQPQFNMYQFLQTPVQDLSQPLIYPWPIQNNTWNADIHLLSTYCFLTGEETRKFAAEDQVYLVKDVFEYTFQNVTGAKKVQLTSSGMVSSWMMYLQRNDVNMRNEWSNYTNWPYHNLPVDIQIAPIDPTTNYGPGGNPSTGGAPQISTGIFITGPLAVQNQKEILETLAIVLNGDYRENVLEAGIYNYVEKYVRTRGCAKDGLYCYNFCLNTDPLEYQPSGAVNLSRFRLVELEMTTFVPPFDIQNSEYNILCDGNGNPIGTTKNNWQLFEYNYNLRVFEERYNILSFVGGNCGMLYSR